MKSAIMFTIALATVVFLSGCPVSGQSSKSAVPDHQPQTSTGQKQLFPEYKVKDFDGKEVNLKDYKGKIIILDLFATWCPPCRMEIPHFVELQNEYKEDLAIIGLSYDQSSAKKVLDFAKEMNINYDMYWGSQEIADYVGLRGIPHTMVIDQSGYVVSSFVGYRKKEVFESAIKPLLKRGK